MKPQQTADKALRVTATDFYEKMLEENATQIDLLLFAKVFDAKVQKASKEFKFTAPGSLRAVLDAYPRDYKVSLENFLETKTGKKVKHDGRISEKESNLIYDLLEAKPYPWESVVYQFTKFYIYKKALEARQPLANGTLIDQKKVDANFKEATPDVINPTDYETYIYP